MKGKIISINPKFTAGAHETFTANNKTFYVFMVSVDIDGQVQIGDANSTLQQPKWELNKECEVTVEKNEKATNGNRFRFQFGDRQGTNRAFGKSVEERMEIISQSSYSSAAAYLQTLDPGERKAIVEKYGPDDAFVNFANAISKKVVENAKKLAEAYGS